ncbi:protein slit-like [Gigantopelta aegis]|uniref:protein slit-like n=1 Tax=Gigantopelta aegis TaxID=1735272 RepID=UPI001B888814|nr:protein slit-like [Gigantopelta aegis]
MLDPATLSPLAMLKELSIDNNSISLIQDFYFNSNLASLKILKLAGNNLTHIGKNYLTGLVSLVELNLSNNNLAEINGHEFNSLLSLTTLDLSSNKLTTLRAKIFNDMPNLQMLNLENNMIVSIAEQSFLGTGIMSINLNSNSFLDIPTLSIQYVAETLTSLKLAENHIIKLDSNSFSSLSLDVLDINRNRITYIDAMAFNSSLITICNLEDNQLQDLPAELDEFFSSSQSVYIGGNPWVCDCNSLWLAQFIRDAGSSFLKYKQSQNALDPQCFSPKSFQNMTLGETASDLESLCVTTTTSVVSSTMGISTTTPTDTLPVTNWSPGSKFETSLPKSSCPSECSVCERDVVTGDVFKVKCTGINPIYIPDTVQEMELSNYSVPDGVLNKDILANKLHLQYLMLEQCGINTIAGDAFQKLSSLSRLYLNGNNISVIGSGTFQNLNGLKELNLAGNSLTSISEDTFSGLSNLTFLALMNNKIASIAANSFRHLQNVQGIFLSSNQINYFDSSVFSGSSTLLMVDVSNNNIKAIQEIAFSGTSLEFLDLTSNQLQNVPVEAIKHMSGTLHDLYLGHNQITTLEANVFEGFNFNSLKLSGNRLSNIDALTFNNATAIITDLSDNRIKTLPFEFLSFLEQSLSVYLGDNPWSCSCDTFWFVQFIREQAELSNFLKYKESEFSSDPTCGEPTAFEAMLFVDVASFLKADCKTTISTTADVTTAETNVATTTTDTVLSTKASATRHGEMTTAFVELTTTSTDTTTANRARTKRDTATNTFDKTPESSIDVWTKGTYTTTPTTDTPITSESTESAITEVVLTNVKDNVTTTDAPIPPKGAHWTTSTTTVKVKTRQLIRDKVSNRRLTAKTKIVLGVLFGTLSVIFVLFGLHIAFRKFNIRSKLCPKKPILPKHRVPNAIPAPPVSTNPKSNNCPVTKADAKGNVDDVTARDGDQTMEDKTSKVEDERRRRGTASSILRPPLPPVQV